jgi:hypothetical protein
MPEHEVMWIGRRPAGLPPEENPAATEDFAGALVDACSDCGVDVEDYVAAAGPYGSWLDRFRRAGRLERLVWNGREGRLVHEQATPGIDWTELGAEVPTARDLTAFIDSLARLLRA